MTVAAGTPMVAAERALVVAEAWTWVGTPYHHRGRVKHVGVDCIQLLAACYARADVVAVDEWPTYSPDWFLHRDDPLLEGHLARYCAPIASPEWAEPGDLVAFRFGRQTSHAGIVVDTERRMIHTMMGRGVTLDGYGPGTPYGIRLTGAWRPMRWTDEGSHG